MKFGILLLTFVAFGNATLALSPTGENVCLYTEKYKDVITVQEFRKVLVDKVEWCWSLPPRCNVKKAELIPVPVQKEVPKTRVVPKCCRGYVQRMTHCVPNCSRPCVNGICTEPEKCFCTSGFSGDQCEKPCEEGTWGRRCLKKCNCHNNETCSPVSGICICAPGWTGLKCDSPCEPGFYGLNCQNRCDCGELLCSHETGICETTTEVVTTTTEIPVYETTTETQDLTTSTESTVTESSTTTDMNQVEYSTVEDLSNSTINVLRMYIEEGNGDFTGKTNETAEDNEIEHSQDLTGVEIKKFNLFNLLRNLPIICGIFLLLFVVTMGSVMINHYRKIRKVEYVLNTKDNSPNPQNFPLHRFYGGSVLQTKPILDNQVCATNVDLRVEQPKLMTFKPLLEEKSKAECIMENIESHERFDSSRESAFGNRIVQFNLSEPRSIAYISTRCKSV